MERDLGGVQSKSMTPMFPMQSFFWLGGLIRTEIADFGPLPGPTRPRGGLGKAPAGALLDLHRFSAR